MLDLPGEPAKLIYGREDTNLLSHMTLLPVLLRPVNNFLGQVIENTSEGKYNTVNNTTSGEVIFQTCQKSKSQGLPNFI